MTRILSIAAGILFSSHAIGALAISQTDGVSPAVYSNGGGTGFGGTLGGGTFTFDVNAGNLDISFTAGGALGTNIVAVYLDTRPGGFDDASMNDTADSGRNVLTNLGASGNETFPTGMTGGLPDFGIAIGGFGTVFFELTGDSLSFLAFDPTPGLISISLSTIGSPATIDWFAALASDSLFLSNESFPADAALNALANPGFDTTANYQDFNRFVAIPEPAVAIFGSLGLLCLLRRRK